MEPQHKSVHAYSRVVVWLAAILLGLLATALHGARLGTLTIRGEESRRARVAYEMLETGDFVVPRQQGEIYLSRPPLGSWLIALSAAATGGFDAVSVRLPSLVATVAITLGIFAYARQFVSVVGAFAGGLAFASMIQVLELGRMAESEAVFTALLAGALLAWHGSYAAGARPALVWSAGYTLAALAGLAKGPQGPVYFVAVTVAFLVVRRDWGFLFSPGHLLGGLLFVLVIGAWQVPFTSAVGWDATLAIWGQNAAVRYANPGAWAFAEHLLLFPIEVWAAMLPWSVLLVAFASPNFRRELGSARTPASFVLVAVAVTFPTCWFAIEARTRYFMPLYPCLSVLAGIVVDRVRLALPAERISHFWLHYVRVLGLFAIGMGGVVAIATWFGLGGQSVLTQPPLFAGLYLLLSVAIGVTLVRSSPWSAGARAAAAMCLVAGFIGLSTVGLRLNELVRKSVPTARQVAEVKGQIPPKVKLVSLGRVHHLFAFHYSDTIRPVGWPPAAEDADFEYFCFDQHAAYPPVLPFAWQRLADVRCDRRINSPPQMMVIVGRRLRAEERLTYHPSQAPIYEAGSAAPRRREDRL